MSYAEAEPGRRLFRRRKHRFISVTISLRDDLVDRIERMRQEDVFPYASRSAVYATLLAIGLKESEHTAAEKDTSHAKPPTKVEAPSRPAATATH